MYWAQRFLKLLSFRFAQMADVHWRLGKRIPSTFAAFKIDAMSEWKRKKAVFGWGLGCANRGPFSSDR